MRATTSPDRGTIVSMSDTPPELAEDALDVDASLPEALVLLVDDNQQNLELILAYLDDIGCRTVTATDGIEAVKAIEAEQPDLVLLDVMMPRMSGFEVCQKIKSDPSTRDIAVIMVTALNEVPDYERAVESGTDDFLSKPVNKLELLTRVKSLLRVRLLRKKLDTLLADGNRKD